VRRLAGWLAGLFACADWAALCFEAVCLLAISARHVCSRSCLPLEVTYSLPRGPFLLSLTMQAGVLSSGQALETTG
jgi:hypothetical protein